MSILVENNFLVTPDEFSFISGGDIYEARAVFSINALKQLFGTLWITKNGELQTSTLGLASYEIYDNDGNSTGISEVGISPDLIGQYKITPVNIGLMSDLTHYVANISIDFDGETRKSYIGLVIGE
jgi:hypothetical protein